MARSKIIYVNGSPIASNSVTGRAGGISSLQIGGGDTTGFEGLLDEVRVYNRALTPEEVTALYQDHQLRCDSSSSTECSRRFSLPSKK